MFQKFVLGFCIKPLWIILYVFHTFWGSQLFQKECLGKLKQEDTTCFLFQNFHFVFKFSYVLPTVWYYRWMLDFVFQLKTVLENWVFASYLNNCVAQTRFLFDYYEIFDIHTRINDLPKCWRILERVLGQLLANCLPLAS